MIGTINTIEIMMVIGKLVVTKRFLVNIEHFQVVIPILAMEVIFHLVRVLNGEIKLLYMITALI